MSVLMMVRRIKASTRFRSAELVNCTEFLGPKNVRECVLAVYTVPQSLVLSKSKPAQYFRCVIGITEFPDQVVLGP